MSHKVEAHETWQGHHESLENIEKRIHDGVPIEFLHDRARAYVSHIIKYGKIAPVPFDSHVVEIGPGVGYLMQAFLEATNVESVTGLDIADGMISHARSRVKRDNLPSEKYNFVHYDGVHFTFPDSSVDIFYSCAAIQHIPKIFAYNIFSEVIRCLKPGGTAVLHLLHWNLIQAANYDFLEEVKRQIEGRNEHWHHFYDEIEVRSVFQSLGHTVEFDQNTDANALWVRLQK